MYDVTELMSIDPLKLTDQNREQIVEEFRSRRHLFNAKAARPKKTKAAAKGLTDDLDLDV